MGVRAEVVAKGLNIPEGPVVLPDGGIAFVEQVLGRVSLFDGSKVTELAAVGGAANAVTLGSDGALYAAQNGGVVNAWRSPDPRPPGIQRVHLDGRVDSVATTVGGTTLLAPNDLVFGPDGRLYFTDPAHAYNPETRGEGGRIFALGKDAGELLVQLDPVYCNGIGFGVDGTLFWVESYERHLCRLGEGNVREVVAQLPDSHIPDGFAVAEDGCLFIATVTSHGVTVVDPTGEVVDVIILDDEALPTNCCFDGNALWVTDFGVRSDSLADQGRLWRVETDSRGAALHPGSL